MFTIAKGDTPPAFRLFQARKARALYRPSAVKLRESSQEIGLRTRWFRGATQSMRPFLLKN